MPPYRRNTFRKRYAGGFRRKGRYGQRKKTYARKNFRKPYRAGRGNAEIKSIDINSLVTQTQTPVAVASGLIPLVLNDIPSGTEIYNRVGRKVTIKSVSCKIHLYPDAGTTVMATGLLARVMLVWDKQPNGVAVATNTSVQDLLGDVKGDGVLSTQVDQMPFMHQNLYNRDRYVVLRDKNVVFQPLAYTAGQPTAGTGTCSYFVKIFKKMNATTIYNGASSNSTTLTPTGTLIQTGRLLLFVISPTASAALKMQYDCRTRFTDS